MGAFFWLPAQAEERWVVAVAELPGLAERDGSGPLLAQLEVLDRQLDGVSLDVRVVPFARSLLLVRQGQADLQMPYIGLPQAPAGLRYGRQALGQVNFALYSRRMEPLRREQLLAPGWLLTEKKLVDSGLSSELQEALAPLLGRSWRLEQLQARIGPRPELDTLAFPYRVETDRAHAEVLGFPALPSNTIRSSLEKLMLGRIQGYVLAPLNVEVEIDRMGLREQLQAVRFADYQALWLVADSTRGAAIEQRFSAALKVFKANVELDRVGPALQGQEHWQPWP
ncbi:hypothetical protein [Pseudomonas sp. GOM6]|uniref:hypothetical protein n=1 Tax=Pseudomonas sp. GOM6 TaxID=3036944 RepID=UPI0024098A95|nr:hypothetical protein [Pseudomonas sp. GOM6]MDG1579769.1 hypothetical protein [Pseudomonas sp. GOM6]